MALTEFGRQAEPREPLWRRPPRFEHGRRPEVEFFAYLARKRAILVGPAAYLIGQGQGSEIDGYDIVIRMNLSCPVPEERKRDIGSRTDILYHVILSRRQIRQRPDLFKWHTPEEIESWRDDGVEWVVSKRNLKARRVKRFAPIIDGILPWMTIPGWYLRKFEDTSGTNPNMGTVAVWHVLRSAVESLHMTGCDFHTTGYYPGYGGFTAEQAAAGAGSVQCWGQTPQRRDGRRMHNVEAQLRYLRRVTETDPRFTADETLTRRMAEV